MTALPRDIVLLSTADWDHPFWTNKQHTAVHLAQRGYRVLYVESLGLRRPTTNNRDLGRLWRRLGKGLRGLTPAQRGVVVHSPLVLPAHGLRLVDAMNHLLLAGRLRWLLRRLGVREHILWTYNPLTAALATLLRSELLIYHCVDDLTAAPGLPSELIQTAERQLVAQADLTFTTSPELQRRCEPARPGHVHYFPNVVDEAHFARAREAGPIPPELAAIPRPRLGFIGAISDYKVDLELIAETARARPDWHWVLIGQVGEGQPATSIAALDRPNIHLLGPRPYAQLPEYLRGFDVATLPMGRNDYTASMFPMKFFEYLAAGCRVVTTDLPALADFREACFWGPASGFVLRVEQALVDEGWDPERGAALAREHTWDRRLDVMERLLRHQWPRRRAL